MVHQHYRDENFDWREEILDGIVARIFQHEYDHILGIRFIDKLSALKKNLIRGKLQVIKKQYT